MTTNLNGLWGASEPKVAEVRYIYICAQGKPTLARAQQISIFYFGRREVCCLLVRCSLVPVAAARSLRATAAAGLLLAVACCCRRFAACCSLLARCCPLPLPAGHLPLLLAAAKKSPASRAGVRHRGLARYPYAILRSSYIQGVSCVILGSRRSDSTTSS